MNENKLICAPVGLVPLQGRNIRLERLSVKYVDYIYEVFQNQQFMSLYRLTQDRSLSKFQLEQQLAGEQHLLPHDLKRIEWVILKKQTPIGLAALADYQINHKRAELLLGINDPNERKGYTSIEAALLVLDFAFNQAFLHKVTSFVYGYNQFAQKNTEHLGFALEGVLREHFFTYDGFIDLYQNGFLKNDFLKNNVIAKLSQYLLGRDITAESQVPLVDIAMIKKFQDAINFG